MSDVWEVLGYAAAIISSVFLSLVALVLIVRVIHWAWFL